VRRLTVALLLTMLAGCGPAALPSFSRADCAQANADGVIVISADHLKFSAPCMIAPAGIDFTIRFINHEGMAHDVAIYDDASRANQVFQGDTISGPAATVDYPIRAMSAGEYYFDCIVHPGDMHGTLLVESSP
jgi:plastocyanin